MPELDQATLAQDYGFSYAVLNSDPELMALFKRAVAETWTPDKFAAETRSTKWYQNNSEAWRNAQIMKTSDPASYQAALGQVQTRLQIMGSEVGAALTTDILNKLSQEVYDLGYDDNQIRQVLSRYVRYVDGRLWGQAGQYEQQLRQRAADQGVLMSDASIQEWVGRALGGEVQFEDALRKVDAWAASAFPHLADRISQGETLKGISEPYRQTMATLLEQNPDAITMQDPMVKQALASRGKDGQPALQTLWEFENTVRQDGRWKQTKNAQNAAMNTTRRVLADFGVIA